MKNAHCKAVFAIPFMLIAFVIIPSVIGVQASLIIPPPPGDDPTPPPPPATDTKTYTVTVVDADGRLALNKPVAFYTSYSPSSGFTLVSGTPLSTGTTGVVSLSITSSLSIGYKYAYATIDVDGFHSQTPTYQMYFNRAATLTIPIPVTFTVTTFDNAFNHYIAGVCVEFFRGYDSSSLISYGVVYSTGGSVYASASMTFSRASNYYLYLSCKATFPDGYVYTQSSPLITKYSSSIMASAVNPSSSSTVVYSSNTQFYEDLPICGKWSKVGLATSTSANCLNIQQSAAVGYRDFVQRVAYIHVYTTVSFTAQRTGTYSCYLPITVSGIAGDSGGHATTNWYINYKQNSGSYSTLTSDSATSDESYSRSTGFFQNVYLAKGQTLTYTFDIYTYARSFPGIPTAFLEHYDYIFISTTFSQMATNYISYY
jgi:hypothetical protein